MNDWTDEHLDRMRLTADPIADGIIADYFSHARERDPHDLLIELMNNRVVRHRHGSGREAMPHELVEALMQADPPPPIDQATLRRAQRLFQDYGPEILTMLGYLSLPTAYCLSNAIHPLAMTGYLERRPMRRVIETSQLVIDVLKRDGLTPDGDGVISTYEVRLMHAAIRYLISATHARWEPDWGHPINQEGMAATLMTFSLVVLRGFDRLGVHLFEEDRASFMAAWLHVGRMMGIDPSLIPADETGAGDLWAAITRRQLKGNEVGERLMHALMDAFRQQLPPWYPKEVNSSIARFYLGEHLADGLGVPRHSFFDAFGQVFGRLYGRIDSMAHAFPLGREAYRWYSREYIMGIVLQGRGHDQRAPFDLPLELSDFWKVPKARLVMPSPSPSPSPHDAARH